MPYQRVECKLAVKGRRCKFSGLGCFTRMKDTFDVVTIFSIEPQAVKVGDRVDVKLIEVCIFFIILFVANTCTFVETAPVCADLLLFFPSVLLHVIYVESLMSPST